MTLRRVGLARASTFPSPSLLAWRGLTDSSHRSLEQLGQPPVAALGTTEMAVFSEDYIDQGTNELWMKSSPRLRAMDVDVHLDAHRPEPLHGGAAANKPGRVVDVAGATREVEPSAPPGVFSFQCGAHQEVLLCAVERPRVPARGSGLGEGRPLD